MPKCTTAHPDCFHECPDGESCIAFYEVETHTCHRGCNGKLLGVALVSAISRLGWDAETSAQGRRISGRVISGAMESVALLADSQRSDRDAGRRRDVQELANLVRAQFDPSGIAIPSPSTLRRYNFEWTRVTVMGALQALLDAHKR